MLEMLLSLGNKIEAERFRLGLSTLVHILAMIRGQHLLLSKVRGQM